MKILNFLVLSLLGISIFLTGCDNKKSNKGSPSRVARGGTTQPFNAGGNNAWMNNQSGVNGSQWSYIRINGTSDPRRPVQGLISASMDPSELGSISSYGDVAIIGYVDMDQNGNVNRTNSRLRIEIWDDFARSGSAAEIALAFNSLTNSSYNGNQITLVFEDQFGQIVIDGQFNQYEFYGNVSYQNYQFYGGGSQPDAGVLGSFQVPICGFFRCQ